MNDKVIRPVTGSNVYIAPTAYVGGEVTLGDECTIMHHVTIRGDVSAISLGARVNVQDGAVLHTRSGIPLEIGDEVTIGHRAVVHCRRIGANTLVGIGAIVLDDCEIGANCMIAAGAVVAPGTRVPDGKLVVGVPARILRDLTEEERGYNRRVVENYRRLGREHAAGVYPGGKA